jgi:hypothetical protein
MHTAGFGPGTEIATGDGLLPVEWLEPGDALVTHSGASVHLLRVARLRLPAPTQQPERAPCQLTVAPAYLPGELTAPLVLGPGQTLLAGGAALELFFGLSHALVEAQAIPHGARRCMGEDALTLFQLQVTAPALILANGIWCAARTQEALRLPLLNPWETALLGPERRALARRPLRDAA